MADFHTDGGPGAGANLSDRIDEVLYRWDEIRRRPVVIVGAILVASIMLLATWSLTRGSDPDTAPVEDQIPQVSLVPVTPPATIPPVLLVHVTGAVARPGVYELAGGSRIADAIAAAGGETPDGQPDRLNLAAVLLDGVQVRVPVEGEAVAISSAEDPARAGPVNLNTATAAQLENLPGVGPATAASIIAYREESGGFGQVADLLSVRGIGDAKLAAIQDLVVVQ